MFEELKKRPETIVRGDTLEASEGDRGQLIQEFRPGERTLDFIASTLEKWAFLIAQLVKTSPAIQETPVPFLGWEDPLEKGKATHSTILAWKIPWTVYSMRSQRVGHD